MPTVLIVDDEQHIRLLIEQTLEELEDDGVELLTAPDGEEALDVVEQPPPGPRLPRRDDAQARTASRSAGRSSTSSALAGTYVVLLTAKGQAYDREQGLAAGADLYLTKPFDPDELLASRPRGARAWRGRSGLMEAAELRRLVVRHRHVAPMLSVLLARHGRPGHDHRRSTARSSSTARPATRRPTPRPSATRSRSRAATVGWVDGPRPAGAVAAVLSYAVRPRDGQARARPRGARPLPRAQPDLRPGRRDRRDARDRRGRPGRGAPRPSRLPTGGDGLRPAARRGGPAVGRRPTPAAPSRRRARRRDPRRDPATATPEIVNDVAADPRATDGGTRRSRRSWPRRCASAASGSG